MRSLFMKTGRGMAKGKRIRRNASGIVGRRGEIHGRGADSFCYNVFSSPTFSVAGSLRTPLATSIAKTRSLVDGLPSKLRSSAVCIFQHAQAISSLHFAHRRHVHGASTRLRTSNQLGQLPIALLRHCSPKRQQ
jgi:hypothetical protein